MQFVMATYWVSVTVRFYYNWGSSAMLWTSFSKYNNGFNISFHVYIWSQFHYMIMSKNLYTSWFCWCDCIKKDNSTASCGSNVLIAASQANYWFAKSRMKIIRDYLMKIRETMKQNPMLPCSIIPVSYESFHLYTEKQTMCRSCLHFFVFLCQMSNVWIKELCFYRWLLDQFVRCS